MAEKEKLRRENEKLRQEIAWLNEQLSMEGDRRLVAEGNAANHAAVVRHLKGARARPGDDLLIAALRGR